MKSVIAIALTATLAAGRRLPAGGAGGDNKGPKVEPPSDDGARYEKEKLAKTALLTCLTTKQGASVAIALAKNQCKTDSDVNTAFNAWRSAGEKNPKNAIIGEWYNMDPDVMDKLGELYPVTIAGATDDTIKGVIGADADATDIAQYKEKTGKATWADTVKTCRGNAPNPTAQKACITDTTADLCTKTANTVPCCATDACTAEDGLRAIEEAADDEMSEETKKCSKTGGGAAAVKTCKAGLRTDYEAKTGKTVDAVGQLEKLEDAAKDAVGDVVGACMGNIVDMGICTSQQGGADRTSDSDCGSGNSDACNTQAGCEAAAAAPATWTPAPTMNELESARMGCRGGAAAKAAVAESMGKDAADVTATDAAKYALDGAKSAGTDVFKTGVGTVEERFTKAKIDMAAKAGKKSGAACEDKLTWDDECMTAVDVRKAVDEGAGDCMVDAIAACVTVDAGACKPSTASVKTAVKECTGYADVSDEKLGMMHKKATGDKIKDARKAAKEASDLTGDALATFINSEAKKACTAAKGAVCDDEEMFKEGKKGAAKEMAEVAAACLDAGESTVNCATRERAAYEDATGKSYSKKDAKILQKDGARTELAELMGACYGLAASAEDKRKCTDPAEKKEIKAGFAAALGKAVEDVTDTYMNSAIFEGATGDTGLAMDSCREGITTTGAQFKTDVKACYTSAAVLDTARARLGKPEAADITDNRLKYDFLQKAAKNSQKDSFEACIEAAATLAAGKDCRGEGASAGAVAKRTKLKEAMGKPDMTDERAATVMEAITRDTMQDDFYGCMEVEYGAAADATAQRAAYDTCKGAADTKRVALTGETSDPKETQKDVVKAAKKKVSEDVAACKAAADGANCGDPAQNTELMNKLKMRTGKIDMTDTEGRKMIKSSGNGAASDFMRNCKEDGKTFVLCMGDAKDAMEEATGKSADTVKTKDLIRGLKETNEDQLTDAMAGCVASGKLKDSTECKTAKLDAAKSSGLYDGKPDKTVKVFVEQALKRGAQKSMVNAKHACLDLAADATAKAACNTAEIADAKKAKAEAEGIADPSTIADADVAKDLKKGKEEDAANGMDVCTAAAADDAAKKTCRTTVGTEIAALEGKTNAEMKKGKIDERLEKAGRKTFAKKMTACMDAADLETGAPAIATAKTACGTDATNMYTKATGKAGLNDGTTSGTGDIKEADLEMIKEDVAAAALAETNRGIKKAIAEGETYTEVEKTNLKKEAIKKAKGASADEDHIDYAKLKNKAGAKAVGEKAIACVATAANADAAKTATGCLEADLLKEEDEATGCGVYCLTDAPTKKRLKRKAQKEILKDKMKACGDCIDEDEENVGKYFGREKRANNDKKEAASSLVGDTMKAATGTDVAAKRAKVKKEMKEIMGQTKDVTDEELDEALDLAAVDVVDDIDACLVPADCRAEVDAKVEAVTGCKPKAVKAKKNTLAKIAAGKVGRDTKDAGEMDEAVIEAAEKAKYQSVGGIEKWETVKPKVKKCRDAMGDDEVLKVKKKPSIDVVVEYAGDCVKATNTAVKTAMDAVDADMKVEIVGEPTKDPLDSKCKTMFKASKKDGKTAATDDELKGVLPDKYTTLVKASGRRLGGETIDVSADQSTEITTESADKKAADDKAAADKAAADKKAADDKAAADKKAADDKAAADKKAADDKKADDTAATPAAAEAGAARTAMLSSSMVVVAFASVALSLFL